MDKSFKVGDYVITFNEDPMTTAVWAYGSGFSISYQKPDNLLAFLASNFDSSQTFLEVLEQRDRLEKENQELKNKETLLVYGISPNTLTESDSTDSIMQTLLKESKEGKKV